MNRRHFIHSSTAAAFSLLQAGGQSAAPFRVHQWQRDERNPILPVGGGPYDVRRCMNPYVVIHEGQYWLFYGGADAKDRHCICLATCPVGAVSEWTRHGIVVEPGGKGSFDERWCVLPCVHRIGGKWRLYYTGRNTSKNGLQAWCGIGMATSDDLRHWSKVSAEPVLLGDGFEEWPDNKGIAGGGPIIELPQPDGRTLYRMNYTLATGVAHPDVRIHQAKQSVTADSYDGLTWTNRRVALRPRPGADYEDIATIALNPWRVKDGWRALYAGIGTRIGAYTICEATSADGLTWERGAPGENVSLAPAQSKTAWDRQMTEYPHLIHENGKLRLFYCGNGYGQTGIGTAVAEML